MEDTFEYTFPQLSSFCFGYKKINWEYLDENHLSYLMNDDHILINKVVGFSNPGDLRKHLHFLYMDDLKALRKSIQKLSKENQIEHMQTLIGVTEDIIPSIIEQIEFKGKTFKAFRLHFLIEDNPSSEINKNVPSELILSKVESFPNAFIKTINEILVDFNFMIRNIEFAEYNDENIDKDGNLKGDLTEIINRTVLETYGEAPKRKTKIIIFKYIGWYTSPENLDGLYNGLCNAGFLSKRENTLADFKAIFSGIKIINKIAWQGNIEELYWFIKCLHDVDAMVNKGSRWIRTCNCFENKDNDPYFVSQFDGSHMPKKSIEILNIVEKKLKLSKPKEKIHKSFSI